MDHTILLFLKIGSLKNITDLYENGTVYMNTLNYFKKVEDGNLRGDRNEGAINLVNAKDGTFRIKGTDREFKFISARYGDFLKTGNLYSLYCVSSYGFPDPRSFSLDERNIDFGSHCLMIKEPGTFIERLESELTRLGYKFTHGFVKYYEEKIQLANLTPFHKPNSFEHQKEFRFFVDNPQSKPLKISIGSMKSYSEIYEAKDLTSLELRVKR